MDRLRAIAGIKLKLSLRGGQARPIEAVLQIIGLSVGTIFIGGLALLFGMLYREQYVSGGTTELTAYFFPGVMWVIGIAWLLHPFSPIAIAKSLHFEGLALLPISRRLFMGALIVNALVDYMGFFVPVLILAVSYTFGATPRLAGAAFVISIVFWTGLLIAGQLVLLTLGRIISSRRFADVALVVGTLITFAFIFSRFFLLDREVGGADFSGVAAAFKSLGLVTRYFPPGLAGWSFNSVATGDVSGALLPFSLLVIQLIALMVFAGWLVQKVFTGEISIGGTIGRQGVGVDSKGGAARRFEDAGIAGFLAVFGFSTATLALVAREWRYFFRDPVHKIRLLSSLMWVIYMVAFIIFFGGRNGGLGSHFGNYLLPLFAFFSVTGELRMATNKFGMDGEAVECVLLSPVSRTEVMIAKTLSGSLIFQIINISVLAVGSAILGFDPMLTILCIFAMISGGIVIEAWGNIISVFFPYKYIRTSGRRGQVQFETGGCTFKIIYMLSLLAANLLIFPIMAMVIIPHYFGASLVGFALIPVSLALAAVSLRYSLKVASAKLLEREQNIIELLTRPTQ